jgi:cytochrome o ubiquinol oxidase operon protein cyoD
MSYVVGFALSLLCTLLAFGLVYEHISTASAAAFSPALVTVVVVLAVMQLISQLIFFLHLGKSSGARWNVTVFGFAVVTVVIVVGGSLWIMQNLQHENMNQMFMGGAITPQAEQD